MNARRALLSLSAVGLLLLVIALPFGSGVLASPTALQPRVYLPFLLLTQARTAPTPTPTPGPPPASDWPQVQKDPQHTGFTPEKLGTNIRVKWTHPFQPERVWPQVQAIVANGLVFVGTEMGHMYAVSTNSGSTAWQYPATGAVGSIVASAAFDNGKVFFGSMDGAVYAVKASDGTLIWKNQLSSRLGFSTAPVVGDGKVMLGGRDGIFYALDPADGHVVWRYDVHSPILMTAAYDKGRVFFGSMDMYVYALSTSPSDPANPTSILAWKSSKISGMAFKDYWPVVYDGYVIVTPLPRIQNDGIRPGFPFGWYSKTSDYQWLSTYGPTIAAGNATRVAAFMNAQNAVMNDYAAHPENYTSMINILSESTGQVAFVTPHFDVQAHNGAKAPPCVDRDGKLILPVMFVRSGWGRIDLNSRRYVDVLYDGKDSGGGPYKNGSPAGFGNPDENMSVSCAANSVLNFHYQEGNANYTGIFNLDTRRWTHVLPGRRNNQMFSNTQTGGSNPASVSSGIIYHISVNELIARTSQ